MKRSNPRRSVGIMALFGFLLLLTPTVLVPVCDQLLELKNGNLVHMRCYYTGQAALIMGGLVLLLALVALFQEASTVKALGWVLSGLGVAVVLLPVFIGVCKSATMPCRTTAVWLYVEGGLVAAFGLWNAVGQRAARSS